MPDTDKTWKEPLFFELLHSRYFCRNNQDNIHIETVSACLQLYLSEIISKESSIMQIISSQKDIMKIISAEKELKPNDITYTEIYQSFEIILKSLEKNTKVDKSTKNKISTDLTNTIFNLAYFIFLYEQKYDIIEDLDYSL